MKEMSDLEKQLRSWIPRPPSAGLERRLFAARPARAAATPSIRLSWAPLATAMLALLCVLFNQRYGMSDSRRAGVGPMVAMILSNQSAAAYLPGSFQAEQNNLPADTFRRVSYPQGPGEAVLPSRSRDIKQP
jgi:hypothetical protein